MMEFGVRVAKWEAGSERTSGVGDSHLGRYCRGELPRRKIEIPLRLETSLRRAEAVPFLGDEWEKAGPLWCGMGERDLPVVHGVWCEVTPKPVDCTAIAALGPKR